MNALRRVLHLQAAIWAVAGLALLAAPRFVLVTVFDQPRHQEFAWMRLLGVNALGLAMAMLMRIALLFSLAWVIGLTAPMFTIAWANSISWSSICSTSARFPRLYWTSIRFWYVTFAADPPASVALYVDSAFAKSRASAYRPPRLLRAALSGWRSSSASYAAIALARSYCGPRWK